jgi:glucose-6-phosphate isomerase
MEAFCRSSKTIAENPVMAYVAARNALYRSGKQVEIMVNYLPNLFYLTEWWKQLYGESEGKEGKGIFPAGVGFTTDLHSMGQYIQDGLRIIFETVLSVENSKNTVTIPMAEDDADGLNYLAGKRIGYVNHMAEKGTVMAHIDGGVPNIRIVVPEINEYVLGQLIYFFELACGLSGYLLGVNPFDQPGVEAYKKNMFALLGKPK